MGRTRLVLFAMLLGCRSANETGPPVRIDDQPKAAPPTVAPPPIPPPSDVDAPPAGALVTKSGVAMKVIHAGEGSDHPSSNDCVKVRFTAWRRDGVLFSSSKHQEIPVVQCVRTAMEGVAEGLKAMVAGEERRLWVPARLTSKPEDPDEAGARVDLTFDLELVDVLHAPPTPADLAAPPKSALRFASGLAMRVMKKGEGSEHPSEDSRVAMHFSGWTTDGTLFESTLMGGHPAVFTVRELVPGWREGLVHMVVGEKARMWIPAALAYGEKPRRRGLPAGPLVYDVELLELETAATH